MNAKKKKQTVTERIRQALDECGESRYRISQKTGIDQAVLSRFVNGHGGMSLPTLDLLCEHLELSLVSDPKTKKKGG